MAFRLRSMVSGREDKDLMSKLARLIIPQLSEVTPMEMVRLAQAHAVSEMF